jgi:hypothetical protein
VVLRVVEMAGFQGFGVPRFLENGRILFAIAFVVVSLQEVVGSSALSSMVIE